MSSVYKVICKRRRRRRRRALHMANSKWYL